jgi:hypothetical protein
MKPESIDEDLVARVLTAVLRELGYAAPLDDEVAPEYLPDLKIRQRFFGGISRQNYWRIAARPGCPPAFAPTGETGPKYRRVADVLAWIEQQTETDC